MTLSEALSEAAEAESSDIVVEPKANDIVTDLQFFIAQAKAGRNMAGLKVGHLERAVKELKDLRRINGVLSGALQAATKDK